MMKLSIAAVTTLGFLAAPTIARGTGKSSMTGDATCECAGPITTLTIYEEDDFSPRIDSIAAAVARTPPNCVLKTPTAEDIIAFPVFTGIGGIDAAGALVPIVKETSLTVNCIDDDSSPTGCRSNWFFLDGSPVPNDADTWTSATQGGNMVYLSPGANFVTVQQQATSGRTQYFQAYYSCCETQAGTCLEFVPPVDEPSSKGKSARRRI